MPGPSTTLLAAALAVTAPAPGEDKPPEPYWQTKDCAHGYHSAPAYRRIRRLLKTTWPVSPGDRTKLGRLTTCLTTRPKAHAAHAKARRWWRWRRAEPTRSWIVYHRLPAFWRAWAERIVQCETGGNPYAGNDVHIGRFEWLPSTWAAAGGTGHPAENSYPQEAVVAVHWAQTAGVGQWACK